MSHESSASVPDLTELTHYLTDSGWTLEDADGQTTMWRPRRTGSHDLIRVVLPATQRVRDYTERVDEALKALSFVEQRLPEEIVDDINFGGADNVAVRLTPDAPSGEAPLLLAYSAISALKNFVVASAAALDYSSLVLPPRRPQRAEAYAAQARLSTQPGSFILSLALPLADIYSDELDDLTPPGQDALVEVPPQPFGRKVTNRMLATARKAQQLAMEVSEGTRPISTFGEFTPDTPNATELAALSSLGGPEHGIYQIRFAKSPVTGGTAEPALLRITPGQQRILGEGADYLRTKQPRAGVTVTGLIVRLFREGSFGRGEAVIQGVADDSGEARRYRVDLSEPDYNEALRAHGNGLQVTATGDLDIRGTRRSLRRLTSFAVIPGLDDEP
ncbi:hypothetical protein [Actinomadura sp. BRA 177]|uniref:hypothetical protein n=1 Tax=Actinomadura sp. BRA 177 TaxID=2745202 RepID=UPI00159574FB|nr:hypothetical protein [Actinomadura sp. BRA 177]NVI90590.1 hypothetical protein [Actinomadura sp. BRA 177]